MDEARWIHWTKSINLDCQHPQLQMKILNLHLMTSRAGWTRIITDEAKLIACERAVEGIKCYLTERSFLVETNFVQKNDFDSFFGGKVLKSTI